MTDLEAAGRALATAHRAHSEAFLRYKALDPKRTDGAARAMADQDVDLVGAEVEWELSKRNADLQSQEFELRRLRLLVGGYDADQPDPTPDEDGEGPAGSGP